MVRTSKRALLHWGVLFGFSYSVLLSCNAARNAAAAGAEHAGKAQAQATTATAKSPSAPSPPPSEAAPTPQATNPKLIPFEIKTAAPPYIDRGVSMAPLQAIASFLEATVESHDGMVIISKKFPTDPPGARTITLRVGGQSAQVQDKTGSRVLRLPLPAEERLSNLFVPLRPIAENLGAELEEAPVGALPRLRYAERVGVLTADAPEAYRGADAAHLTIVNRVGRPLSLRLTGPQRLAFELGCDASATCNVRPGVYYYLAASAGMKTRSGARRLMPARKATWDWGHR